jgi:hypothetical protein
MSIRNDRDYRSLFRDIMSYRPCDRMPVVHWGEWRETRERWLAEGLPFSRELHEYLKAVPLWASFIDGDSWLGVGSEQDDINVGLFPPFETEVIEEADDYWIRKGADGVIRQEWKHRSGIPHDIGYTLRGAKDWDEYKRRLQPDPRRIAPDIEERLRKKLSSKLPVCFAAGSLMGWIRNWMGLENMVYLMFDRRDVYADMVMTIADLTCWAADQILPRIQADLAHSWEDICGRGGPLISPDVFDECVAPGYQRIRRKLEEYGVSLYSVDSDGDISALIGHWLDAGVNILFPLEVGPFKGDANKYRKKYGKSLRLMGNFNKLALEVGRAAVDAEIERLIPLMKEGGYIITSDHHITPGVALNDYRWYLDRIRSLRL